MCGVGISYSSSEIRFSHSSTKYPTHLRLNHRHPAQAVFSVQLTMAVGKVSSDLSYIRIVADGPQILTEQASLQG